MIKLMAIFSLSVVLFSGCLQRKKVHVDPVTGLDTSDQLFPLYNADLDTVLLIPYRKGEKWGFADTTKSVIIKPRYDYVKPFQSGMAIVGITSKSISKYGIIDKKGKLIIPINYDYIKFNNCDLISLRLDRGIVIINNHGRRINKHFYTIVYGRFCAENKITISTSKYGTYQIINTKGQKITDTTFSKTLYFHDNICPVTKHSKWGAIDTSGKVVVDFIYNRLRPFYYHRAKATISNELTPYRDKWGLIDDLGNVIIPFEYDEIMADYHGSGRYIGVINGLKGELNTNTIFDINGNCLYTNHLTYCEAFVEGLAPFEINEKFGYIDIDGQIIIEPQYDYTEVFSMGLAWVRLDGKYGLINKKNKAVIPFNYQATSDYSAMEKHGILVKKEDVDFPFYIDKNGMEYYE